MLLLNLRIKRKFHENNFGKSFVGFEKFRENDMVKYVVAFERWGGNFHENELVKSFITFAFEDETKIPWKRSDQEF